MVLERAPVNEIPALVAFDSVMVRTSKLAIAMSGVSVYRHGFEFNVVVRRRDPADRGRFWESAAPLHGDRHEHEKLEIDVEYHRFGPESPAAGDVVIDTAPTVTRGPGGGTRYGLNILLYAAPLPATSDVTIAVTWPAFAVPRTQTRLPGAILRNAVARVIELWPPALAE